MQTTFQLTEKGVLHNNEKNPTILRQHIINNNVTFKGKITVFFGWIWFSFVLNFQ